MSDKYQVYFNREPVSPVLCEGDAHMWLLRDQTHSIDYALRHDYELRPVKSMGERTREMADYALAELVELLANTEDIDATYALRLVAKRIGRENTRWKLVHDAKQATCCESKGN